MRTEHVVYAVASALTVTGAVTGREQLQWAGKPLLAPTLAVRALRGGRTPESALLAGALGAATAGDVLLIDPDDDARLIRGATSFAVMQTCYGALFARRGARPTAAALLPRLLGWLLAALLLRRRAPAVAPTLTGYGITLAAATTLASDPALAGQAPVVAGVVIPTADPRTWSGLGALLFTVSDALIVGRKLFLRGEFARRAAEGVVLATYAGAQVLLVEAMIATGRE